MLFDIMNKYVPNSDVDEVTVLTFWSLLVAAMVYSGCLLIHAREKKRVYEYFVLTLKKKNEGRDHIIATHIIPTTENYSLNSTIDRTITTNRFGLKSTNIVAFLFVFTRKSYIVQYC